MTIHMGTIGPPKRVWPIRGGGAPRGVQKAVVYVHFLNFFLRKDHFNAKIAILEAIFAIF